MSTELFLITHKPEPIEGLSPYRPILSGAKEEAPEGYLRDDLGENISALNPIYNEMTAIYWVYRHLDEFPDLDHVGFCHYRRFLCFQYFDKPVLVRKKARPDWVNIDERQFQSFWKEFDIIVPCPHYVRSVRRHYEKSHNKEDLGILEEIIGKVCPQYLESFQEYIDGDEEYLYNMFVLPRDLFLAYGDFVFPVLEAFAKERPYKEERMFASERLTGVFLHHLRKSGKRALECPVLLTRNRSLRLAFTQTKENFKEHPEFGFFFKTKPLWLTLLPRFFEQRLRNWRQ